MNGYYKSSNSSYYFVYSDDDELLFMSKDKFERDLFYAKLKISEDTKRIDKLQSLTKGYGKGWLLRESSTGRGMRLHETSQEGANPDIRNAIDNYTKSKEQ